MGTHPIFESDFDCLTDLFRRVITRNLRQMDAILAQVNALKSAEGEELVKLTEALSSQLKTLKLEKVEVAEKKPEKKKSSKIPLKNPKGTRDYGPGEMAIREDMFNKIVGVFKKHGAETIDTPIFELKEILTNKYGEDSKLIYDIKPFNEAAVKEKEELSLRYDLTVPFARYVAQNKIQNIKRYHIAKVYRRDQPYMSKGRYREFYQCDFDIAGANAAPMLADAECVKIVDDILRRVDVGDYLVKINDRRILDGIFAVCGCPDDKFRGACAEVDKLDKLEWDTGDVNVKHFLLKKGVTEECADLIGQYVRMSGGVELCDKLLADEKLAANASAKAGLEDMKILLNFLKLWDCTEKCRFDLSLARGLDYYTGPIFEATIVSDEKRSEAGTTVGVGSVAGGGRYDNLVGGFAGGKGKSNVPCVGVSLGIERLFSLMEKKVSSGDVKIRSSATEVYVVSGQKGQLDNRATILNDLWKADIPAETSYKPNPKLLSELQHCEKQNIPLVVLFGSDELERGVVKVRNVVTREETEVERANLVDYVKSKITQ